MGVKMRKSHSEHFSTAVPQKTDVVLTAADGSFVPVPAIAAIRGGSYEMWAEPALTPP
jgi:hypothetical protein